MGTVTVMQVILVHSRRAVIYLHWAYHKAENELFA